MFIVQKNPETYIGHGISIQLNQTLRKFTIQLVS